jgi:hypothetical protein
MLTVLLVFASMVLDTKKRKSKHVRKQPIQIEDTPAIKNISQKQKA